MNRFVRNNTSLRMANLNGALSPREIQIVRLICDGRSDGEVAEKLSLSISTVRTHRKTILRKLHLKKTVLLVRYAIEQKII